MMQRVTDCVQKATSAEDAKYSVAMDCEETSIVVYQNESPHWTVTINLTSRAMRQQADEGIGHYYTMSRTTLDGHYQLDQPCYETAG